MWEDSALIFLLHIHPSLGYHFTWRMQQTSTADVMSSFSVHKRYKLGPIFLRTVSMSTLYFHTVLLGQHQWSLFALKVETNFLFQYDGPGSRTELKRNNRRVDRNPGGEKSIFSSSPPQSSRGRSLLSPTINLARETQIESLLAGYLHASTPKCLKLHVHSCNVTRRKTRRSR